MYSRTSLFRTRLIRSPRYFEGRSKALGFTLPLYASPVISKPSYFELFFHFPWDFEIAGFDCITILSDHFSWKLSGDWLLFAGGSFKTDLFCGWFVPYIRDMIGFSVVQVVIKPRKVVELQISANKTPLIQTTRRLRKVSVLAGCPYQVGHVVSVRKSPFVGTIY